MAGSAADAAPGVVGSGTAAYGLFGAVLRQLMEAGFSLLAMLSKRPAVDHAVVCGRIAALVASEQATVRFAPVAIHDLADVLDGAVKIVGVSDDQLRVARCEGELRRRIGAYASAARSQPYYLDVTHPDANKGVVVRTLARLIGVALEHVAAIGDMPNDVLMFGVAGTSIAMGNASPDVQRTARHVTTSNEEDGFARAVEMFVLGRGNG
jgi:hypothetical protein